MRCLLVVLLALLAVPALAQESSLKEEAAALVVKAQGLESQGDFSAAANEYRTAYTIVPHPVLLFNLAQVYRQGNDKVRAYYFYRKYLITEPSGHLSELATKFLSQMASELGEPIPGPPAGDDILVQQAHVEPVAEPERKAVPPPQPPPLQPPPTEVAARRDRHFTPATWALTGVSVAALGVGGYLAVTSYRDYGDCEDQGACESDGEVDGIRRRAIAGDVLLGLSLASAITTGILYWRSGGDDPAIRGHIGAGGASVSWASGF